jgi:hypothetical protein
VGMFLSLSGVVDSDKATVERGLREFALSRGGCFKARDGTTDDPNILVLHEHDRNCGVMYPSDFFGWDDASKYLSAALNTPVFSFHIHDGDLWMFILFDGGEQVAQFNPLPDYWDDSISDDERRFWRGDVREIVTRMPGMSAATLEAYLKPWDLDAENPGKAFPDDEFCYHEDWQMCDFMKRLGVPYPLGDQGQVLGKTFEFTIPEARQEG